MAPSVLPPFRQAPLGAMLKRWRLLHRVKQAHAAELFGVAQSTISRWEAGLQDAEPEQRARIEALLAARLDAAADAALARLVANSTEPVHLVCDLTHRLLACSRPRADEFAAPVATLLGHSLWPFATETIAGLEARLDVIGWRDDAAPPALEFNTGNNDSTIVPIHDSVCRWTRLTLASGAAARLVETLRSPCTQARNAAARPLNTR